MNNTCCPKCGRDFLDEYLEYSEMDYLPPHIKITNYRSWFDGSYSGTDWDVEMKCPDCGTEFSFTDGDC